MPCIFKVKAIMFSGCILSCKAIEVEKLLHTFDHLNHQTPRNGPHLFSPAGSTELDHVLAVVALAALLRLAGLAHAATNLPGAVRVLALGLQNLKEHGGNKALEY